MARSAHAAGAAAANAVHIYIYIPGYMVAVYSIAADAGATLYGAYIRMIETRYIYPRLYRKYL